LVDGAQLGGLGRRPNQCDSELGAPTEFEFFSCRSTWRLVSFEYKNELSVQIRGSSEE
jgi:hypothetical protein